MLARWEASRFFAQGDRHNPDLTRRAPPLGPGVGGGDFLSTGTDSLGRGDKSKQRNEHKPDSRSDQQPNDAPLDVGRIRFTHFFFPSFPT